MRTLILIAGLGLVACSSSDTTGTQGQNGTAKPEPTPAATPVTTAAYPTGSYGFGVGMLLPQNLSFKGLGPGGSAQTYTSADFFDSDGSKGINAIIFDTSAQWCGACQQEASGLESKIQTTWGKDGVTIITLIIEDNNHVRTSDVKIAQEWITQFHLTDVPVVMDQAFRFAPPGMTTIGLPNNTLVDPRTMKIVQNPLMGQSDDPAIAALVAQNQAH